MQRSVTTRYLYDKTSSGHPVPSGSTTESHSFEATGIVAVKTQGIELLDLFRRHSLDPSRSPSLVSLVEQTAALSDGLLTANDSSRTYLQLFAALQLSRLIDAVSSVSEDPALPRVLSELLDGTLDLLSRTRSKAKDTLWELELLGTFKANGVATRIGEPDLLLTTAPTQIGVACKKLYSEANFSKVLSGAIDQIRKTTMIGLVAVSLDDLVPQDSILKAASVDVAADMLNQRISDFMTAHERHLRRYLVPGRAIAVLVSCAALTDLEREEPRFCTFRQTVAWHIPAVSPQVDSLFDSILSAFRIHERASSDHE